jgi:hypothetical protein
LPGCLACASFPVIIVTIGLKLVSKDILFFTILNFCRFMAAQTKKLNRRTLPFIQAMEDIRFCAIQERNYMILKSICDNADPDLFKIIRNRYNQEDHLYFDKNKLFENI